MPAYIHLFEIHAIKGCLTGATSLNDSSSKLFNETLTYCHNVIQHMQHVDFFLRYIEGQYSYQNVIPRDAVRSNTNTDDCFCCPSGFCNAEVPPHSDIFAIPIGPHSFIIFGYNYVFLKHALPMSCKFCKLSFRSTEWQDIVFQ